MALTEISPNKPRESRSGKGLGGTGSPDSFKSLYRAVQSDRNQFRDAVKSHHRHIASLIHERKIDEGISELQVMYCALTDPSLRFCQVPLPRLLVGSFDESTADFHVVNSFHLLLLQTLIQHVSSNLQSIVAGESGFSESLFGTIADSLRRNGSIVKWIEKSPTQFRTKAYASLGKVCKSFLKIVDFLLSRVDRQPLRDSKMDWTLLHIKFCKLADADYAVKLPIDASGAALQDLNESLYPETLTRQSPIKRKSPTESLQFVLKELQIKSSETHSSPQLYSRALSQACSLRPTDKSVEVIENVLQAFQGIAILDLVEFRDCIVGFSQAASSTPVFPRLLDSILPTAFALLPSNKELLSFCFRYGNEHQHHDALLLGLQNLPNVLDIGKRQRFRELTLQCLYHNEHHGPSYNILIEYLADHKLTNANEGGQNRFMPESVLRYICYHAKESPELLKHAFFTEASEEKKLELFMGVLEHLEPSEEGSAGAIFRLVETCGTEIKLFCQLKLESKVNLQLPLPRVADAKEGLLIAAIYTQRLKYASGKMKSRIIEIREHFASWLRDGEMRDGEADVLMGMVSSLYHACHFDAALDILAAFDGSSHSNQISLEVKLSLEILRLKCMFQLCELNEIPFRLSRAGKLIKEMSSNHVSVEGFVIEWKLLQYDYFISTENLPKAEAKFDELNQLLRRRPELNLEERQAVSVDESVKYLLLGSKFLQLSGKLEFNVGNFVSALKNVKLARKIAFSVLKKLKIPCELRNEVIQTILECLKNEFEAARHAGASNEACKIVGEIQKLQKILNNELIKAMTSLELADMLLLIGDTTTSTEYFEEGAAKASESDMHLLGLASMRSELLQGFKRNQHSISVENRMIRALANFDRKFQAFSVESIKLTLTNTDFFVKGEESITKPGQGLRSRREVLLEAILTAKREVNSSKGSLPEEPTMLIVPSSSEFFQDSSRSMLEPFEKLLDHKEALLQFLERSYLNFLGLEETKELQSILTRCVLTLSQISILKVDNAQSLLKDVFFLQDFPRYSPMRTLPRIYEGDKTVDQLLPAVQNAFEDNLQAKNKFFSKLETLLPSNFAIITIDICSSSGDLIFARIDGSGTPSLMKLSSRQKSGTGKVSFLEVLSELRNIIEQSHQTTDISCTREVKTKDDRRRWWKTRFELDARMKDLLDDVNRNWIGGFNGLFTSSSLSRSETLYFKSELSRVWSRASGSLRPLEFSDFVTGLYLNVQSWDEGPTLDESLEDLIIFTARELGLSVDQKKIAGDLKKVYARASRPNGSHIKQHLVLIPGHSCSEFPWESLSCLKARSVSRMLSVGGLLDLLESSSLSISRSHERYYILNPGGDLKKTEERFKGIFQQMPRSKGLIGQAPSEDLLLSNLFKTEFFFYAGHGGGEQFMRMTELIKRRNESDTTLPPALLMGCSSGALQKHGRLEPSSNPFIWLLCGSPMVVSNLWDITDKDIDAFSTSVLGKWGLIEDGADDIDIARAVAQSRDSCVLKYLNGAAPVIHGLPIQLI